MPGMTDDESKQLLARICRLEARQDLAGLLSRYCVATDDRDFNALAKLFTENAEFGEVRGRDAIVRHFIKRTSSFGPSYHYIHDYHFDLHGEEQASGIVNGHAEMTVNGKAIWSAMRYQDRYERLADSWQFAARHVLFRYVLPFEEIATQYGDILRRWWPGVEPQKADLPESLDSYWKYRRDKKPG